jgi:Family of unknown function (DUF6459)
MGAVPRPRLLNQPGPRRIPRCSVPGACRPGPATTPTRPPPQPAAFAGNVTGSGYNSHRPKAAAPSRAAYTAMSDLAESAPPGGPMPPSPPVSPRDPRPVNLRPAGRAVLPLVPGPARRPARPRPLPDAAAVSLSAVPDSAPPYDDAGPASGAGRRNTGPARPGRVTGSASAPRPGQPGPGQPGPDPAAWPSRFAQVLAEALAGSRPRGQIRPWATDQALRRIRQLGPMLAAPAGGVQPRVRRVVTSRPAAGVVEMSVVVGVGPSIRALAVRLEHDRSERADNADGHGPRAAGWICTAIEAA